MSSAEISKAVYAQPAFPHAADIRWPRRVRLLSGAMMSLALAGCYVLQAARGQAAILIKREPIDRVVARTKTAPDVRSRLEQVLEIRDFASRELGLPRNRSYTTYADIGRSYVVWNVFAAPEFSVAPQLWCFPVAGCVPYRGYFSEKAAQRFAARLKAQALDVHVSGATAYSTLGHFADPVLSTMIRYDDVSLASIIFHELSHQQMYLPGDSSFNEAFATAVEQAGVRRWLLARNRPADAERFDLRRRHFIAVNNELAATRERLRTLYKSRPPVTGDLAALRASKQQVFEELGLRLDALSREWSDGIDYRNWMARDLNNARLAAIATYYDCVPGFDRILGAEGGDFSRFYARVAALSKQPLTERRAALCNQR